MKIKKFVAPSLPEALSKIRQDMGEEAVILKTRFNGGAGKTKKNVEVTAAIDGAPVEKPVVKERNTVSRISTSAPEIANGALQKAETAGPPPVQAAQAIQTPSEILADIKRDLVLVKESLNRGMTQSLFGQPCGLQIELARQLVQKGLSETLAIQIIGEMRIGLDSLNDPASLWKEVKERLANLLKPGEPIKLFENNATVILLVGPTGSGKTATAARLAFHHSIEKGLPATLISADSFRADSREQLKSLSSVIGCQSVSISTPDELAVALKSYKKGLIIIDTSGVSNAKDIAELIPLVGAANPHEIHMVIPADMPARDIRRIASCNPDLKVDRVLVTKLDQSQNRGGILSAAKECDLQFSYQCASREMPGLFGLFNPETFVSSFMPLPDETNEISNDSLEVIGW